MTSGVFPLKSERYPPRLEWRRCSSHVRPCMLEGKPCRTPSGAGIANFFASHAPGGSSQGSLPATGERGCHPPRWGSPAGLGFTDNLAGGGRGGPGIYCLGPLVHLLPDLLWRTGLAGRFPSEVGGGPFPFLDWRTVPPGIVGEPGHERLGPGSASNETSRSFGRRESTLRFRPSHPLAGGGTGSGG